MHRKGVKMFEKEAKERARTLEERQTLGVYVNDEDLARDLGWNEGEVAGYEEGFKDGAEFGYNKANEWHYVKNGLPKTSGKYLVYTGGEPFILDFATEVNSFGYWVVLLGDDWGVQDEDFETVKDRGEDDVIAWKEIELPKEIKEND